MKRKFHDEIASSNFVSTSRNQCTVLLKRHTDHFWNQIGILVIEIFWFSVNVGRSKVYLDCKILWRTKQ